MNEEDVDMVLKSIKEDEYMKNWYEWRMLLDKYGFGEEIK